jgi:predicted RNA-binding Zn ribbon-like protein
LAGSTSSREADRLVVDFANTVACPGCRGGDAFASSAEATRWVRRRLPNSERRLARGDARALVRFRGELRRLLESAVTATRPSVSTVAAINRAATRSPSRSVLRWNRGRWEVEELGAERSGSQRLMALTARAAIELVGRARPLPVRKCEGPGCVHFLLAHRSEQRWCSPTGCGNRARVQRHYRKARAASRTS